jgi:hypothetical protein
LLVCPEIIRSRLAAHSLSADCSAIDLARQG